jgi:hypothetical protein
MTGGCKGKLLAAVCVAFGSVHCINAATITAKSAAFTDVNSAVNAAADGDTVVVPAGTVSWTDTLSLTKNITLQGQTKIEGSDPSGLKVRDGTVILDNVPRAPRGKAQPKASPLIYGRFSPAQRPRISGLTFKGGTVSDNSFTTAIYLEGTCPNVRIDHCSFDRLSRYNLIVRGHLFGVMDHCFAANDSGNETFFFAEDTYAGANFGDGSWTDEAKFGTDKAFYVEDCAFTSVGGGHHGMVDGAGGMRRVVRHCFFLGPAVHAHGTETGGRQRGSRMVEVYLNTFDLRGSGLTGMQHRAGTGLYWGNTFLSDPKFTRGLQLTANRQLQSYKAWGGANGQNPLDSNDTEGDGRYIAEHRPHLFFSGAASAVGDNQVTQNEANWKVNQWAGFEVTNNATGQNALIIANSSGVLSLAPSQNGRLAHFGIGDKFVVYRLARASLDQPGMGKGDLLVGNPPTNRRWPNQQPEPLYSWLNTRNGVDYAGFFALGRDAPIPTIRENRDYFNWEPKFDGSSGVGVGRRSARPSKCTQGVGYWATDEDTLYVATAPDEWSAYYKPFVYPHPLSRINGPPAGNAEFPSRRVSPKIK